jgi:hypothetical protein
MRKWLKMKELRKDDNLYVKANCIIIDAFPLHCIYTYICRVVAEGTPTNEFWELSPTTTATELNTSTFCFYTSIEDRKV